MHFLNDKYKNKIIFLSLLFSCFWGGATTLQDSLLKTSPVIKTFESNKIINSSPNYSILFDKSGIMFIGQEDKISIYNGSSWNKIPIKGKVLLARNSQNIIFFSGENTIGYLVPDSLNQLKPHYVQNLLPQNMRQTLTIRKIECLDNTSFFCTDSVLFAYNLRQITIINKHFNNGEIFKCGNKIISVNSKNQICIFKDDLKEKCFSFSAGPIKLILEHESGYLVITKNNKCFITNNSFTPIDEWQDIDNNVLKHGIYLNSNEYIFYDDAKSLKLYNNNGNINTAIFNSFNIPNDYVIDIVQENSGNIWILFEKSIIQIEYPSAIKIISDINPGIGNALDIKTYNNKIYIAATQGLFYFDPLSKKYFKTCITDYCYQIIPVPSGLIAITPNYISLINKKKCVRINSGQILDICWNSKSNQLFISKHDSLLILRLEGSKIVGSKSIATPVKSLKIMSIDSSLWITDGETIYSYDNLDATYPQIIKLFNPAPYEIIDLFNWHNKVHILTIDKIYSISLGKVNFERSLPYEISTGEFLSIFGETQNNMWILSRNKDKNTYIWFTNHNARSFSKISIPASISHNNTSADNFGTNKLLISDGSQILFLDVNFYDSTTRNFSTIIKEIKIGNKVIFSGVSYDFFRVPMRPILNNIPYNLNDLRIELSSTCYNDNNVNYQYLLKGYDKLWSEWSTNSFIQLQNLKEGQYELKIRCKDYLNESSPEISLLFRIKPPFYRTFWAFILYSLVCGILLFIAYKSYQLNFHHKSGNQSINNKIPSFKTDIPEFLNSKEPTVTNKKFDFYSNIDDEKGKDKTHWDKYEMVTVLFSDIQGFTKIAESMNPELLIDELDRFFYHFDSVVEKYNIEKIKTIGDAYMAAGGIPKKSNINPIEVVLAALEMQNYMKQLKKSKIDIWDLRIGIHSGPVIAGVIGHKKRSFDIWGDTVNTASRMETTGEPGKVNISGETYKFVKNYFICEYRGKLPVKYKGNIDMYFVKGLRPELSINLVGLPNRKFYLKLQMLRLSDLEDNIFSKLEVELDKNLYFHNLEYARHMYDYSDLMAKASNLDLEDTLLIRTSALLFNTGFTQGYENLEIHSAEFARNILPEYNYSEKQISLITNLILAAKWPPEPSNLLEMVLTDTKMEYIGRADYIKLYKLLFLEQNNYSKTIDVLEFKRKQIEIIQHYPFFTESARRLREVSADIQIARIKEDDWN